MGYYLKRDGEIGLHYGITRWKQMLELARVYGWQPAGAILDEESAKLLPGVHFKGYEDMADQLVTVEDAANIADAVERALTHLPRHSEQETITYQLKASFWEPPTPNQVRELSRYSEPEDVRDSQEESLQDFVDFCREGAFRIS